MLNVSPLPVLLAFCSYAFLPAALSSTANAAVNSSTVEAGRYAAPDKVGGFRGVDFGTPLSSTLFRELVPTKISREDWSGSYSMPEQAAVINGMPRERYLSFGRFRTNTIIYLFQKRFLIGRSIFGGVIMEVALKPGTKGGNFVRNRNELLELVRRDYGTYSTVKYVPKGATAATGVTAIYIWGEGKTRIVLWVPSCGKGGKCAATIAIYDVAIGKSVGMP